MTASEILQEAINGARSGIETCYQRRNAHTHNIDVASILQHLERAMTYAYIEIEKGNAK